MRGERWGERSLDKRPVRSLANWRTLHHIRIIMGKNFLHSNMAHMAIFKVQGVKAIVKMGKKLKMKGKGKGKIKLLLNEETSHDNKENEEVIIWDGEKIMQIFSAHPWL
ncbi:hypothetical protein POVCU1_035670 [Plasmodium ovale curtisi]|uniref:Uncharacterized protein n=1 Tax=Plasmodium ovale curtisi TaxID=864141 RepID=A0A1A8X090_PLAOA|nr:hypothetical protein POVCU1_035670 [Plasmodium ovale curtisi]